ncbi:hypothetical protein [Nocardioides montaniterrae]
MTEVPGATPSPTGNEAVDTVIDMVAALDERPLAEHAAVFEDAHAQLRVALDRSPGDSA